MSEVSAFQMYKSKNKQAKTTNNVKSKRNDKFKKKKKQNNNNIKKRFTNVLTNDVIHDNCKFVKKLVPSTSKNKNKHGKKKEAVANGNLHVNSDEEAPLLVPILHSLQHKSTKIFDADTEIELNSFLDESMPKAKKRKHKKVVSEKKRPLVLNPNRNVEDDSEIEEQESFTEEPVNEDSFAIGEDMLKYLMAPTNLNKFFSDYWEKKPLYVPRDCELYYSSLISSEKLDNIIRNNNLHYSKNIDIVSYENGKRETLNPSGCAVPAAVWDFYGNGCSVRILNPQTYSSKLYVLISTLQEYFGNMVGTNLYLTPPGSQGFAPHYDDIEAFVIQIEGRKHWKLYAPKNENEALPRYSSKNLDRNELNEPIMEVTLHAGDFLYFPRGTIHEAHTDEDAHSLHITISMYQKTAYVDLFEHILPNALKEAVKCDKEFRKGLPLQYLRHLGAVNANQNSSIRKQMLKKLDVLFDKLKKYISVDSAADELGKKFMHDAMPPYLMDTEKLRTSKEGGERLSNGEVIERVEFDLDTEVRLLRYHCLRLVQNNDTAIIYYCTENALVYHEQDEQMLEIDPSYSLIVETLQNLYPNYTKICDLPVDDEIAKMQVISDLWEHKLIVTKEPLSVID